MNKEDKAQIAIGSKFICSKCNRIETYNLIVGMLYGEPICNDCYITYANSAILNKLERIDRSKPYEVKVDMNDILNVQRRPDSDD